MRIICPKCAAAYDIPTKAIPLEGREVQCSSCTHAWYQLPLEDDAPAPPLALTQINQPPAAPKPNVKVAPEALATPLGAGLTPIHAQEKEAERIGLQIERLRAALTHEPRVPKSPAVGEGTKNTPAPPIQTPQTPPKDTPARPWTNDDEPALPPRRKLDPQVLEVLREEAVRETRARKADPSPLLDPQADLGLDRPPRRPERKSEGIREKLARLQAAERAAGAAQATAQKAPKQTPQKATTSDTPATAPWMRGAEPVKGPTPAKPAVDAAPKVPEPPLQALKEPTAQKTPAAPAPVKDTESATPTPKPASPRKPRPHAGLPVALSGRELALITERRERVGFRWGFGATAGVCCAALALYLSAAPLARALPEEQRILELVAEKGALVQERLADGVRSALNAIGAETPGDPD